MASIKKMMKGRSDVYKVDPRDINVMEGFNCRDFSSPQAREELEELKSSILAEGVKVPLACWMEGVGDDAKLYIENGGRRHRAIMELIEAGNEVADVPIILGQRDRPLAERLMSQITMNSGAPFTPLEQAHLFSRLQEEGLSVAEISRRSGKSRTYVTNLIRLHAAPEELRQRVASGEISATLAMATIRSEGVEGAAETLTKAADVAPKGKVTAKQLRDPAERQEKEHAVKVDRKLNSVRRLVERIDKAAARDGGKVIVSGKLFARLLEELDLGAI